LHADCQETGGPARGPVEILWKARFVQPEPVCGGKLDRGAIAGL